MRKTNKSGRAGWFWAILIVAIGVAGVAGVKALPPREDKTPPMQRPPVNVVVEELVPLPELADVIRLPAVIEANRIVKVSAEVDGRIEAIPVKEGQRVKEGDLLVRLNTDLLQAAHDRILAQVKFDEAEYERIKGLTLKNVVAQQELDRAQSAMEVSRASLAEAKARLARAAIKAPAAGTLDKVPVETGEYLQIGTMVAQIVDMETVKVVVQAPERDAPYFHMGGEADVVATSLGEKRRKTGKVTYISKLADQQTRTTRMEITVGNEDQSMRSGQLATVSIARRVIKNALLIPLEAVIPQETGHSVFVVENGKAQSRMVKLGLFRGNRVLVLEGLKGGDQLIVEGHRLVGPGQSVQVRSVRKSSDDPAAGAMAQRPGGGGVN
ncbi:MAG TPA: efflux RND transporter periplasmic adaptor subunit [Candidatus Brocadiia bacterium]|nr:efflux RND transporter periplasmic adaptor subunit [Candidatus Brocadiia bacterium]